MSHAHERTTGSRRIHRALSLGLSGTALVGLVYLQGASALGEVMADEGIEEHEAIEDETAPEDDENEVPSATLVSAPHAGEAAPVDEIAPTPAPTPAPERLAMADVAAVEAAAVDAAAALPVEPPVPALVAVPDLEGMTLRKAKKQLAALGLKMSVRDEYGDRIPRDIWQAYKVRSQKLEAGTEVEPGSTVKIKARMRASYAMGY